MADVITTTDIRQESVMGTYTARKPCTLGNIPMSFAPMLYADPSYLEADRAPMGAQQQDGVRFIAKLGRILRSHS